MANTKKGAIKKTTKRGRDENEYKNDRENKRKPSIRSDLITIINNMGNEHTEKEMEGREAERRERFFSCSNIEEEGELDEITTKEKKRKMPVSLRVQLLKSRTLNETNGSMIQVRKSYIINKETIIPNTNIADEERKEDEEVEKEGEEEEKKEEVEEWEEVSSEVEQRKDDNEKSKKTIKERRKKRRRM